MLYCLRRERQAVKERAEAIITLASEQEAALPLAIGTILRGWTLAEQGQIEEGITQICQGLAAYRATGAEADRPYLLALLAKAYGEGGQAAEGLRVLTEELAAVDKTRVRFYEAELYRLKGTLTLQSKVQSPKSQVEEEAEEYFLKAIDVARQQQAKSLELRAAISLARLWQQQGQQKKAHAMLAEIYNWFTEGFDTKDLQEAKTLLEELH
jgi:predicted ATPase